MTIRAIVQGVPQSISARAIAPLDRSSPSNVSISRIAQSSIQKYQIVVENSTTGKVLPANIGVSQDNFLGVALSNAATDTSLDVRIFGELYDPTWSWSVGSVYCNAQSQLTQINLQGTLRKVAHAVSAHTLVIDLRDSVDGSSKILSGEGPPDVSLGAAGDIYLDTSDSTLYGPKTSNWSQSLNLQGSPGQQGEDGDPGPPGQSVENFVYYPPTITNVWLINHPLGRFPSVIVQDSTGDQVWADVRFVDINTVEISFAYPIGGRAILT